MPLFCWFHHFSNSRAEIVKFFSLVFWSKRLHQKDILKLTDLYLNLLLVIWWTIWSILIAFWQIHSGSRMSFLTTSRFKDGLILGQNILIPNWSWFPTKLYFTLALCCEESIPFGYWLGIFLVEIGWYS